MIENIVEHRVKNLGGGTLGCAPGLLLSLQSEITPHRLGGPYEIMGIETGSAEGKENVLSSGLSLQPQG